MTTQTRLLTLDEFLRLPETKPYTELIDGVPEQKPVGKQPHSISQFNLGMLLRLHPSTRAGRILPEQGFRFPRTSLGNLRVPDLAYYVPQHMPSADEDYPEKAPDLAAEIRSKGQSGAALRERLTFLRGQGTTCTLLIDPEVRTVEVHDGDRSWLAAEGDEVELTHLNGFAFKVRELFE